MIFFVSNSHFYVVSLRFLYIMSNFLFNWWQRSCPFLGSSSLRWWTRIVAVNIIILSLIIFSQLTVFVNAHVVMFSSCVAITTVGITWSALFSVSWWSASLFLSLVQCISLSFHILLATLHKLNMLTSSSKFFSWSFDFAVVSSSFLWFFCGLCD